MDRSTARTLVSRRVEDPNLTRWTPAEYNSAIQRANEQFALESKVLKIQTTLTSTANQAFIDISSLTTLFAVRLVRHKGIKLAPTSEETKAKFSNQDFTDDKGTPLSFWIDNDRDRLYLYPIPESGDAGENVTLDYFAIPAASTDSQNLLNQEAFQQVYTPGIVAYSAWELLGNETPTPAVTQKRADCFSEYQMHVNKAIDFGQNIEQEPIAMTGGRDWASPGAVREGNAFDT